MPPVDAAAPWTHPLVLGLGTGLLLLTVVIVVLRRTARRLREEVDVASRRAAREHERVETLDKELKAERALSSPESAAERPVIEPLARAVRDLAACGTRDDVAQSLGRAVASAFAPKQWMVFLAADEEGREFVVAASGCAEGGKVWAPGARLSSQTGRVGLAVRRRIVMDRRDFEAEPPIVREQLARTEPEDFDLAVVSPVVVGERVAAVVAIGSPEALISHARHALDVLSQVATVVLRAAAARERAERFANQDTLTGVGNKSWFNATAAEEIYRMRQAGGTGALVLFGVDAFAHYARRNGHAAGDKLVKGIAQVIRPLIGDDDLLARWGGDEFVVFRSDTDMRATWELATKIRRAVSAVEWPFAQEQPRGRVTLCAGIASFPGTGDSLESLIEGASQTLAEARAAGGDTTGSIQIEPIAGVALVAEHEAAKREAAATAAAEAAAKAQAESAEARQPAS